MIALFIIILAVADLTAKIAEISRDVSLVAIAVAALSWGIGSAMKGIPLPLRELREFSNETMLSALKSIFWLSSFGVLSSLVVYLVSVISLAAK